MTREKKNATLRHFSKEYFSICVNEKTVEGEICGRKVLKRCLAGKKNHNLPLICSRIVVET